MIVGLILVPKIKLSSTVVLVGLLQDDLRSV